ncbi:zinc finger protein 674-like isoform X1 [Nerophis ophidion]|uniref:zinc finger protein 674-like isoform X1 n=1 Tax=Nerophis ophidion TaxID=159077 RepID=UPI002ADF3283|nr:zinc finger protein 674-like isoform X1 [Nerophis ophidion]
MLKELVNERMMAAADEIFALFEKTIALYEKELSRTREEEKRHRQQLEAVSKTHIVLHVNDGQQLIARHEECPTHLQGRSSILELGDPQPSHIKEEEEEDVDRITEEGEFLQGQTEVKLSLTGVSVKTDHHVEKPQADVLAPLSDSGVARDDTQAPLSSDTDCEGDVKIQTDNKHSTYLEKKTGKKHFTCSICDENLSNKSHLNEHMLTHRGRKPWRCTVCGKIRSKKSNVALHIRTHTGEKPFRCSVCGLRFSQKSNMVAHMRTHTGEKPFTCLYCGERFSKKSNTVKHVRTHTGEKPYKCAFCAKTFSRQDTLMAHMGTHNREKAFRL